VERNRGVFDNLGFVVKVAYIDAGALEFLVSVPGWFPVLAVFRDKLL
jgi:hypothetical protein